MMGPRRTSHLGELALDIGIVIGSAFYVYTARNYPADGRQIPTLVGYLAVGLGSVHLLGHLVPRLWAPTHDARQAQPTGPAQSTSPDPGAPGDPAGTPTTGDTRQVLVAMGWALSLLVGLYVVGYVIAIPVFFLAYFGARRAWRLALISAVVMGVVTEGLFVQALSIHLPVGLF